MARSHRIVDWDPEDLRAWETGNKAIARRNLICMVASDHVAVSIWSLWSVMVLFMPESVYGLAPSDKLLLGAVATFFGGCVRIPYTLGIAKVGGRNWTTFSALVLIVPTVATIMLLARPGLPLWPYVVCAALTGLGGGNYSASLTNVNAFYPQRLKGRALALDAGVANLGVAVIQLVALLVLAVAGNRQPYWVCAVYLVLLVVVGIAAALFMDNLDHRIEVANYRAILSEWHTWGISLLYIGTFGSFIGFSFAFGRVLYVNFLDGGQGAAQASLHVAQIAFVGPLLGSLSRIYGGRLADRVGGSRVTLGAFAGMTGAAGLLAGIGTFDGHSHRAATGAAMVGYIVGFIALFVLSGIGNGSVFKMIPVVFETRSRTSAACAQRSETERRHWARAMSGALIGFAGAVGALGGVCINLTLRQSYQSTGQETPAFWTFLGFYLFASALTWVVYVRRPTSAADRPDPATASAHTRR